MSLGWRYGVYLGLGVIWLDFWYLIDGIAVVAIAVRSPLSFHLFILFFIGVYRPLAAGPDFHDEDFEQEHPPSGLVNCLR